MSLAAVPNLQAAMVQAYKEGLGADFTLMCEGETKKVHSVILMARSPFFEAKINRWSQEKREMVIEDCDLVTLNIIVDYMYGINIPSCKLMATSGEELDEDVPILGEFSSFVVFDTGDGERLSKLLKVSDRFQMSDLKAELDVLITKTLSEKNLNELCNLGERFSCKMLIEACAELMAKHGCTMSEDDVKELPKVASACFEAFGKQRKAEVDGKKIKKKARKSESAWERTW